MSIAYAGRWGTSAWGTSPWGGIATTGPDFGVVYAAGDRFVHVEFDAPPQAVSPNAPGDALNPATWSIVGTTTGRVFTVLAVKRISATVFEIFTLEEFDPHFADIELSSSTLRNAAGIPIGAAIAASFRGVRLEATSTYEKRTVVKGNAPRDFANPPTPNSPVGGTFEIDSGGDYELSIGAPLLRKLVLRRLVSAPGDFFHLPEYGVGLREKDPLPVNDIRALKRAIENQISMEPEVESVQANVSIGGNVVNIQLLVKTRPAGETIEVGLSIPPNSATY
jgi:hypothetical protein